jgi:polysaccharide deacetylase family protein (PEP-CTERM system associated)
VGRGAVINAMSIDLEDWFCVQNLSGVIRREDWDTCESRVAANTRRLLALLERHDARATFFVLGWIADRLPDLVRDVERAGHEIASHGYDHRLLTGLTADEFDRDLGRALASLQNCGLTRDVVGYRAPSFTMVRDTMPWALPVLERHRISYDSSIVPVGFHPDYGVPDGPLRPFKITDRLHEFPLSCIEVFGRRLPCCGGAYFRLLPYAYTRYGIRRCHAENRQVVFYLHPWEIDPGQPRMALPWSKRIRHYYGLAGAAPKFERLLRDFRFTTIREVLGL